VSADLTIMLPAGALAYLRQHWSPRWTITMPAVPGGTWDAVHADTGVACSALRPEDLRRQLWARDTDGKLLPLPDDTRMST
jgi:hypothetical protein